MRLEECDLNIVGVLTAPLVRTEPEPVWVAARDRGLIPESAFTFYRAAGYLSFGAAPPYLADDKNLLFSYFGMLLNGVREAFVDAEGELRDFREAQSLTYDPGKRARGESWDPDADKRAKRHFRILLLSLQSGLDATADLVALFLTGLIPGLRLGRAQFSRVETWLSRPLSPGGTLIIKPQRDRLERLHARLEPIVNAADPEREWLPLMRMFRNKAAHLNDAVFRYMGLPAPDDRFYTFLPRQWPFIPEEHIRVGDATRAQETEPIAALLRRTLLQQDIVSYAFGLRNKVKALVDAALDELTASYAQLRGFPLNAAALAELEGSVETYEFRRFEDLQDAG